MDEAFKLGFVGKLKICKSGFVGGMRLPITESKCSCRWLADPLHPQKPPRRDARVHRGGVMKSFVRGKHLRLLVRKCPSSLEESRENFLQKGFPGCFPLVSFLCRSKGKYTKKQSLSQNLILCSLNKNQLPIPLKTIIESIPLREATEGIFR